MIAQPTTELQHHPLHSLIQAAAGRIVKRHPHMQPMVERAIELVERGAIIRQNDEHLFIFSTSGREYELTYNGEEGWSCTCEAYEYSPTIINGRHYCKHIIAQVVSEKVHGAVQ